MLPCSEKKFGAVLNFYVMDLKTKIENLIDHKICDFKRNNFVYIWSVSKKKSPTGTKSRKGLFRKYCL